MILYRILQRTRAPVKMPLRDTVALVAVMATVTVVAFKVSYQDRSELDKQVSTLNTTASRGLHDPRILPGIW
jgi:hypothetical protein